MFAILKKELKTYYTSLFAYVYYMLFFLVAGIMFSYNCLETSSTQFGYYVLTYCFLVVFLILPFTTMRLFSQEKKMRTDQMLFTAPVSTFAILTGKYLATVIFVLLPVALSAFYPVVIASCGTMSVPYVLCTYIGGVLVTLALLSIGIYISTLTGNTVLAAVINYVLYVCILLGRTVEKLAPDNSLIYDIFHETSLYNKFYDMSSGIVRSRDVIFLLLTFVVFFALSYISLLDYRRRRRDTILLSVAVLLCGGIVWGIGISTSKVHDFTYERLLTLSEETKAQVSSIESETIITYLGNKSQANATYVELLNLYDALSDHLHVEYIPLDDVSLRNTFLAQMPTVNEASMVISSGSRYIYLDSAEYVSLSRESSYSYRQMLEIEDQLTSGILYVNANDLETIVRTVGHGEALLGTKYTNILNLNHFEFDTKDMSEAAGNITTTFSESVKAVFVNAPQTDFSESEIAIFDDYLKKGGTMIVSIDPLNEDLDNFNDFLKAHGLSVLSGVVIDTAEDYHVLDTAYYLSPKIRENDYTRDILKKNMRVVTYTSKGLARNGSNDGYETTDILVTSDSSFAKVDNFDNMTSKGSGDVAGPFSVASVAKKKSEGTIFLVTSNVFFMEDADEESLGANRRFFVEMVKKLLNVEDAVWIEGKNVGSQVAYYKNGMKKSAKTITIFVVPSACLLFGIAVFLIRRRNLLLICAEKRYRKRSAENTTEEPEETKETKETKETEEAQDSGEEEMIQDEQKSSDAEEMIQDEQKNSDAEEMIQDEQKSSDAEEMIQDE